MAPAVEIERLGCRKKTGLEIISDIICVQFGKQVFFFSFQRRSRTHRLLFSTTNLLGCGGGGGHGTATT